MRWLLLVALVALGACKGDDKPAPEAKKGFAVQVDPTDSIQCGFGTARDSGPWDEVTLSGDGAIKWTHLGGINEKGGQDGFEKSGTFDAAETKAWLQTFVDQGLVDRAPEETPAKTEHTRCEGQIDSHRIDWVVPRLPESELRGQLDALTARAIRDSS